MYIDLPLLTFRTKSRPVGYPTFVVHSGVFYPSPISSAPAIFSELRASCGTVSTVDTQCFSQPSSKNSVGRVSVRIMQFSNSECWLKHSIRLAGFYAGNLGVQVLISPSGNIVRFSTNSSKQELDVASLPA